MKIAFHINGNDAGGVAMWTRLLCEGLHRKGHELFFIANREGAFSQEVRFFGEVHCLNVYRRMPKALNLGPFRLHHPGPVFVNMAMAKSACLKVERVLTHWGIDVLMGNGPGNILSAYSSVRTKIPLILTVHNVGSINNDFLSLYARFGCRQLNSANCVVGVSRVALHRYKSFLKVKNCVIPNACKPLFAPEYSSSVRKSLGIPFDAVVVGTIGRVTFDKGYHVILESFLELAKKNPMLYCILAGSVDSDSDYLQSLVNTARLSGMGDRIIFPGVMEPKAFYNAIDVLISGGMIIESFGLIVIEAMSAGVPVIAPNVGGPLEILAKSTAGILVPPGNPHELFNALKVLINDPVRRTAMGEEGRRIHGEFYGLEGWLDRWEQCICEVLLSSDYGGASA